LAGAVPCSAEVIAAALPGEQLSTIRRSCTWYAATLAVTEVELSSDSDFRLDLRGLGKGMLILNGHYLGRYWLNAGQGNGADQGSLMASPATGPANRLFSRTI